MGWKFPRPSRRAFLQTTGCGTAGLSLLSPLGGLVGKAANPVRDCCPDT